MPEALFAYDITHWTTFIVATLLLNISPGPDLAFILGHTIKGGKRAGTAAMIGIWTGAVGHIVFAVSGLTAIVAASAEAFSVIKWVGVAYLVWLGIGALRSPGHSFAPNAPKTDKSLWAIYRQGALIDLLNPKVAIFFLAFLPQFTHPEAGPIWAQMLLHGSLVIVGGALTETPVILLSDKLTTSLRTNPRAAAWLDRTLGGLFITLAARLAYMEK